jgi:S-adenosylmethionine uptake transporter
MYSMHYATMKWLGTSYPLWQLIFIRSALMFIITLTVGGRGTIRAAMASPYKLSTAFRAVLQFLSALCFYVAASAMSLPAVTTIYSTAPMIIVILSIFFLGETVKGYRWVAVIVGLIGTVIAANPGGQINLVSALIALGSALFWALTVVLTRKSGARESSSVQLLTTGIVFMVMSGAVMTWQTPSSLVDWALMLFLGIQIYLAQLFFFEACRFAPASLIGPLEYSSVIWACIFGYLIFQDTPTLHLIIGALLVVASGIALAVSARHDKGQPAASTSV